MSKRERGGPVMFNLRVRPTSPGVKVTKEALAKVVSYIKQNDAAPRGWEVAYIEWTHPKGRSSTGWKRGTEEDLGFLGRVLRKMGGLELRAAEVEKGKRGPSEKRRKHLEREITKLERKLVPASRKHRAAVRERDRRKSKEARAKWERVVLRTAARRNELLRKQDRLTARLFPEEPVEFELAVNYKGKGRRR